MNSLEERQAQLREEQKRKKQQRLKKRYGMTKSHEEKLIKSLEKSIAATDDPQLKARLTGQLTRVLTVKPEVRAKRSKDFKPSLRELYKGSVYDEMSDGELFTHHLVVQIEAKCRNRGGWGALTRPEKDALLAEATETLSTEERAAIEMLDTEGLG
jgi:hypothetical protein